MRYDTLGTTSNSRPEKKNGYAYQGVPRSNTLFHDVNCAHSALPCVCPEKKNGYAYQGVSIKHSVSRCKLCPFGIAVVMSSSSSRIIRVVAHLLILSHGVMGREQETLAPFRQFGMTAHPAHTSLSVNGCL